MIYLSTYYMCVIVYWPSRTPPLIFVSTLGLGDADIFLVFKAEGKEGKDNHNQSL